MNKLNVLLAVLAAMVLQVTLNAQDIRTIETRVADLLARFRLTIRTLLRDLWKKCTSLAMRALLLSAVRWYPPAPATTRRQGMPFQHSPAISRLTRIIQGRVPGRNSV